MTVVTTDISYIRTAAEQTLTNTPSAMCRRIVLDGSGARSLLDGPVGRSGGGLSLPRCVRCQASGARWPRAEAAQAASLAKLLCS